MYLSTVCHACVARNICPEFSVFIGLIIIPSCHEGKDSLPDSLLSTYLCPIAYLQLHAGQFIILQHEINFDSCHVPSFWSHGVHRNSVSLPLADNSFVIWKTCSVKIISYKCWCLVDLVRYMATQIHEYVTDINTLMQICIDFRIFYTLKNTSKVCKKEFFVFRVALQTQLAVNW